MTFNFDTPKFIAVCSSIAVFIIIGMVSQCTKHGHEFEADRLRAKAELEKADAAEETEELRLIKELIDSGVNPIAARCAIVGWGTNRQTQLICAAAVGKPTETEQ